MASRQREAQMTGRGWGALGVAALLYVTSRIVGSANLHMVAVGVAALPIVALVGLKLTPASITLRRRPATTRSFPGARLRIDLDLRNTGRRDTPLVLVEDVVPAAFGRPARAVIPGIPASGERTVSYLVSCRRRGRYEIGPARLMLSDAFGMARLVRELPETDEVIVYPEIEPLPPVGAAAFGAGAGESPSHRLLRRGEDFFGMRAYMTGDDLRRIHWPSTARSGELMIRQEEAARRASATILLDTRAVATGKTGSPGFERSVSAAASLAALFSKGGFALRLATPELPPTALPEQSLLDHLAAVRSSNAESLSPALTALRARTVSDGTLLVVTAPPLGARIPALTRAAASYGPKVAVLVYPADPADLPVAEAGQLEGRASAARASLARAGWDVFLLAPNGRLRDVWKARRTATAVAAGWRS